MTNKQRFETKFKIEPFGHWLWIAGKTNSGHGSFKVDGKSVGAHVYSMIIYKNFDPNSGKHILHKPECNNPSCVNPEHLYIGTNIQNMRDKREQIKCCPNGHEFNERSSGFYKGARYCKICKRDRSTIRRKR